MYYDEIGVIIGVLILSTTNRLSNLKTMRIARHNPPKARVMIAKGKNTIHGKKYSAAKPEIAIPIIPTPVAEI